MKPLIFALSLAFGLCVSAAAQEPERPKVLFFTQPGCRPCEELYGKLAKTDPATRSRYVQVNVTRYPELFDAYRVHRTPTLIAVRPDGKEIRRTTPAASLTPQQLEAFP